MAAIGIPRRHFRRWDAMAQGGRQGSLWGAAAVGCGAAPLCLMPPQARLTGVRTRGRGAKGPHQAAPITGSSHRRGVPPGLLTSHRLFASFPGRPAGAALPPRSHGVGVKAHRGQQDDGGGLSLPRPTTFPLYDRQYKGQFHSSAHPSRYTAAHSDGCGSSSSAVLPSLSPWHISGVRLQRPNSGSR